MKTKSPSQITRELTKKSPIFVTVAALVLCASPAIALAESCIGEADWTVASGSWFNGNNWSGGSIPSSSTRAQISNGGTATIGSTGAVSCDLTMPASATQSGRLVVDHGGLDIAFDAAVGGYGRGVLIITNGGTVSALAATIAATSGSVGTVSVDGGSFTVGTGFYVGGDAGGSGGTGLLTITNSATVTAASAYVWNSGTLTGNGTVTTTSGTTVEGTLEPSSGRLSIAGNLTFNGNAALMLSNVVPASADNVYVSGGRALLTGKLKVRMTGTFTPGTTYTLLHADNGLNGTQFSSYSINYPTNQCFTPVVTYDASNVYLYLQPNCL
jgi:hypothetical protein